MPAAYTQHLSSSSDLITSYEATRTGFIAFALEKNRLATPYIEEARTLHAVASTVSSPWKLLEMEGIESALLTAAGLSDKALQYFDKADRHLAISGLIEKFLEPA